MDSYFAILAFDKYRCSHLEKTCSWVSAAPEPQNIHLAIAGGVIYRSFLMCNADGRFGMADQNDDQYSPEETEQRLKKKLKGAFSDPFYAAKGYPNVRGRVSRIEAQKNINTDAKESDDEQVAPPIQSLRGVRLMPS
jgi:hypothetical protein